MKKYSLIMQFIGIIVLIISVITSIIIKNYSFSYIIMGILLLIISYNNKVFYKRKHMTLIYLLVGIYAICMGVFYVIGR